MTQLEAAPGKADQLLETLRKAQAYAESDAEPGCLLYRISHDPADKGKVCVMEVYVSASSFRQLTGKAVIKGNEDAHGDCGLSVHATERPSRFGSSHRFRSIEE